MAEKCEHLNFHVTGRVFRYKAQKGDKAGPPDGLALQVAICCEQCGLDFIFPQMRPDRKVRDGMANEDQTLVFHRIEPKGYQLKRSS